MSKWLVSGAFASIVALSTAPAFAQGHNDPRFQRGGHEQNAVPDQGHGRQEQAQNQQGQRSDQQRGFAGFAQYGPTADQRQRENSRPSAGQQAAPQAQPTPPNMLRGQNPNNATRGPEVAQGRDDRRDNGRGRDFERGRDNGRDGERGRDNGPGRDFSMRGPGGRPDFSRFHRNFTAPRHFHVGVYHRPRGWYAHRWVFGEILPSLFWTQDYWLTDYWTYGLEPPPPGTVWVRDGDDALLIDRFSGEIIQVAYNVFY